MKFNRIPSAVFLVLVTISGLTKSSGMDGKQRFHSDRMFHNDPRLERIIAMWNRSSYENGDIFRHTWSPRILTTPSTTEFHARLSQEEEEEETLDETKFSEKFSKEFNKCINDNRVQIVQSYNRGKAIIFNCFKYSLILNLLKNLGTSSKSTFKLFNGMIEIEKITDRIGIENSRRSDLNSENNKQFERLTKKNFTKRQEYFKMYKKAMEKLQDMKKRVKGYESLTDEERQKQLDRIDQNSQALMEEIIKNVGNEKVEREEEKRFQKELLDPKLLSILNAVTKSYMVKLKFYPGVAARMMRSNNGGVTFDLELDDPSEDVQEETTSDESSTREIRDGGIEIIYEESEENSDGGGGGGIKKKKKNKEKKQNRQNKKKVKKIKKIMPYLLIPLLIQAALLPFVFKKLFFLAMKALFAGKVALLLVGFNLLRNTCIKHENDNLQKIRVEHYGYNQGEEYGAYINGRSLNALSDIPYRAHNPDNIKS